MATLSTAQLAVAELKLAVTHLPTAVLRPDPKNARQHGKGQIRKLADGIRAFGFVVPILVDGQCNVMAGHARLLAAQRLGLAEVPTVCLEHLDNAQIAAFSDRRQPAQRTVDVG